MANSSQKKPAHLSRFHFTDLIRDFMPVSVAKPCVQLSAVSDEGKLLPNPALIRIEAYEDLKKAINRQAQEEAGAELAALAGCRPAK
jgi:hypothetical protein